MQFVPSEFDDIRPFVDSEIPAVIEELAADPQFEQVMASVMPGVPYSMIVRKARQCKTSLEFQYAFDYPFLEKLEADLTEGLTFDCKALDVKQHYTFISNHRDICLDGALLCKLLVDAGFPTTAQLAVGDNLLIKPWISKIIRLNKGIVVKRGVSMREQLLASMQLSRYFHFVAGEVGECVWLSQRQGRAKDASDQTQESIIKMLCMGGEGSLKDRLKHLNVVPLTISYEFDPCDWLKAQEFQLKRDVPDYKKSAADDLANMSTGIMGYKGHVHFQASPCLNDWTDGIDDSVSKGDFAAYVAKHIDYCIHSNYRLYPCNYIAHDRINGSSRFADRYTDADVARFDKYLDGQLHKVRISNPDIDFLRHNMLEQYAHPLSNYLNATAE